MGRGILTGLFWGTVVSAVVLALISISTPLPPRPEPAAVPVAAPDTGTDEAVPETEETAEAPPEEPEATSDETPAEPVETATPDVPPGDAGAGPVASQPAEEVPLPARSQFDQPPPDEAVALPAPDAPLATDTGAVQQTSTAETSEQPRFGTAPAPQPQIATAPGAGLPDAELPAADLPQVTGTGAGAGAPVPAPPRPRLPQIAPAPSVAQPPAPPAEPAGVPRDATGTTPAPLPQPRLPQIGREEDSAAAGPRLPRVGPVSAPPAGTPRLPQISGLPGTAPGIGGTAMEDEEAAAPPAQPNALSDHAAPFEAPAGSALLAVILIDEPDGVVPQEMLTRLGLPVTFAIDPLQPGAAERMAAYRAAGFEVVLTGPIIPDGAATSDVEVALAAALDLLPSSVALLDTLDGRIHGNRPILEATVAALDETGHGLVAFPRGLNTLEEVATRAGVPAITAFRLIDGEAESAPAVARLLSRAGVVAGQAGAVVVVGRTRPDTVTALVSWAEGNRAGAVVLAPLSAALERAARRP